MECTQNGILEDWQCVCQNHILLCLLRSGNNSLRACNNFIFCLNFQIKRKVLQLKIILKQKNGSVR